MKQPRLIATLITVVVLTINCSQSQSRQTSTSSYPIAVDAKKVGKYPPLTKSGGGYFYDDVLEYRVWINPPEGGDDYYKAFATYEEAVAFSKKTPGAEEPLVLVLQKEWIEEPKPGVFVARKDPRITEWQVKWLIDDKRSPSSIETFLNEQKRAQESRAELVELASRHVAKFAQQAGLVSLKSSRVPSTTTEIRIWRGGGLLYPRAFILRLTDRGEKAFLVTMPSGRNRKYEQTDLGIPHLGWDSFIEQLADKGIDSAVWLKFDPTYEPDPDEEMLAVEVKKGQDYSFVFYLESTKTEDGKKAFGVCRVIESEFGKKLGCN